MSCQGTCRDITVSCTSAPGLPAGRCGLFALFRPGHLGRDTPSRTSPLRCLRLATPCAADFEGEFSPVFARKNTVVVRRGDSQ